MKLIKQFSGFLAVTILVAIVFLFFLGDVKNAQLSLNVLGMHSNNVSRFSDISNIITSYDYQRYSSIADIDVEHVVLIEEMLNSVHVTENEDTLRIPDVFASKGERWNAGCQPNSILPAYRFEYILYSENSMIICFLTGGLGVSSMFEFYSIGEEGLDLVGSLNSLNSQLFMLTLDLKYEEHLVDFMNEGDFYK